MSTRWRKLREEIPPTGRLLRLNVDGGTVLRGYMLSLDAPGSAVFFHPESQDTRELASVEAWALEHEDYDFKALIKQNAKAGVLFDPARHIIVVASQPCPCAACGPEKLHHVGLTIAGVAADEVAGFAKALTEIVRVNFPAPARDPNQKPCNKARKT